MAKENWNPGQYNKFKEQRAQPFWDLLSLVKQDGVKEIIDLGCGTGELTAQLHQKISAASTLGIDNSEAMLLESRVFVTEGLRFEKGDLQDFNPDGPFDLVFSNAALQWIENHEDLFPRIFQWVAPKGQVAIQMPYNFDHPSHRIAHEVAQAFSELAENSPMARKVLPVERYAEILYRNGFHEQKCRLEVYLHPMESAEQVVEWTKGTLLTSYQGRLSKERFEKFVSIYREKLLFEIGTGPYAYAFKRILIWGKKND